MLELLSVSLDDRELAASDYQLDENHLTLHPASATFTVDTSVKIHPESNTALEGLYKSSGMFCTQCEAEGFRKITYYLDRPDVMSRFTTTVVADSPSSISTRSCCPTATRLALARRMTAGTGRPGKTRS